MSAEKELKKLRKEEQVANELLNKNKKKLDEIGYNIELKKLALEESLIEQQRLKLEYDYKYSDDSINTTESWELYLKQKRPIEDQIRFTKLLAKQESGLKKSCSENAANAREKGDLREASAWLSKADNHQENLSGFNADLKDYYQKIKDLRTVAEQDPEYAALQARMRLARMEYESIESKIADLQIEYNTQKKVYEDSKKEHRALRKKIENFTH